MHIPWRNLGRGLLITLVVLMVVAGAVVAQQKLAASDTGILDAPVSTSSSGQPDGVGKLLPGGAPKTPAGSDSGIYDSANPATKGTPAPDDNPVPDSSLSKTSPSALSPLLSYYTIAGTSLRPRNSVTTYAYDTVGCLHITGNAAVNPILNAEFHIPEGSLIKYIRLSYGDTSATGNVAAYLTRYAPGVSTTDLTLVSSDIAFSGGFGFVVSTELNETVNNTDYVYTVLGFTSSVDSTEQICGIRVAYYAPVNMLTFLPAIVR
jgi:hypothetical protein